MAITSNWCTGWEYGLVNSSSLLFDTLSGTPANMISTTSPRNGAYCGRITAAGATAQRFDKYFPSTGNQKVVRFGGRTEAFTATSAIMSLGRTSAPTTLVLRVNTNEELEIYNGTSAVVVGQLTIGNWHLVEFQYDASTTTHSLTARIDGGATANHTLAGQTTANMTSVRFGSAAISGDFGYDDFVIGDYTTGTDWYGAGKVEGLTPGSDGTHSFTTNDFSTGETGTQRASSYTSFFNEVNDLPFTTTRSTTKSVAQRVVRSTGYVELVPQTTDNVGVPSHVHAYLAWAASTTGADTMGTIIRNADPVATVIRGDLPTAQGGNNGALADYSETTVNFTSVMVTPPAAGWTDTGVEALRWRTGGATDVVGIPTVQALLLEVDWPLGPIPDIVMAPMRSGR